MKRSLFYSALTLILLASIGTLVAYPHEVKGANNVYLEDLILSFQQNMPTVAANVTAVQQCETSGSGAGYTVSGRSTGGYWYYLALYWNYPASFGPIKPSSGYLAYYEVFDTNVNRIFYARNYLSNIGDGDSVLLQLSIIGSMVNMKVQDWYTGKTDQESFTANGATSFTGESSSSTDSNGYFSGMMTREYHDNPYFGDERLVTYSWSGLSLSSAWMRITEFSVPTKATEFESGGSYSYSNSSLRKLSSNGATVSSNPYEFVTGTLSSGQACAVNTVASLPIPPPALGYALVGFIVVAIVIAAILALRRPRYGKLAPPPDPWQPGWTPPSTSSANQSPTRE